MSFRNTSTTYRTILRPLLLTLATTCATTAPAWAGGSTDVNVSIGVSQPGFYGQINIGDAPPPAVIYPQPVVIVPDRRYVHAAPLYLRVPPGHERHWSQHCAQYRACGRPVYFVRYDDNDERRWHDEHDHRDHDRGDDRGRGDDDRGHGRGRGRGHGHGHD